MPQLRFKKLKTLLQRVHLCVLLISTPQVYFRNWCVLQCDVLRVTPGSQTGGIIIREITSYTLCCVLLFGLWLFVHRWCFGFSQFLSCLITYPTLISFTCIQSALGAEFCFSPFIFVWFSSCLYSTFLDICHLSLKAYLFFSFNFNISALLQGKWPKYRTLFSYMCLTAPWWTGNLLLFSCLCFRLHEREYF